jgi:NADH:ubiquinone oxidoreductase subunit H
MRVVDGLRTNRVPDWSSSDEASQMVSYEVTMGLSIYLLLLLMTGTLSLEISEQQSV